MEINHSSISQYKSKKTGSSSSALGNQSAKSVSRSDSATTQPVKENTLADLKVGQQIKGQIIDHRLNEVRVQIEPGKQVVTAKLSGDISLSIGQEAQFQVTEHNGDRLVLKYISPDSSTPPDAAIQKALTASGLAMTDRNKTIVGELLRHTMPVDKQTLQTLIRISNANREASALTLVLMHKNNIPMTASNIAQFEAYQNGTQQMMSDIKNITASINELLSSVASMEPDNLSDISTTASLVSPSAYGIDPNATPNTDINIPVAITAPNSANSDELLQMQEAAQNSQISPTNASQIVDQAIMMNKQLIDILYPSAVTPLSANEDQTAHIDTLSFINQFVEDKLSGNSELKESIVNLLLEQIPKEGLSEKDMTAMVSKLYPEVLEQIQNPSFDTNLMSDSIMKLSNILGQQDQASLSDLLASIPGSEGIREQISFGTATIKDVLQFLQNNLQLANETIAQKILTSSQYQKLLEQAFLQKWTITPEKLAKKTPVKEMYQNLQEDMEKLNQLANIRKGSEETLRLQEPVKNMQENIRFIKDLNEAFTYLPLPVQLKEQNIHSELYVFTKKHALHEKKALSVLLHLDMEHLGPLNIHVGMEQNMIRANFSLDNMDAMQIIESNLPSLSEALAKKGYQLQYTVSSSYNKPDLVKDLIEENTGDSLVNRYTFDIRT
ncbi:flagellar hook-length control protein FliK [Lachnospiraceae bacterium MD1]|uniref:Flagellar hook-length control protein FliK n=1 Tax=Variimorphobacter saccharofermentans TaxID=2755051 RepID=A0A839K352_9FIRM|nr:flagellar hook-length control protein FliK [Variimorphobacter saccharofermentans]MBB2183808.1 flagellar hook-length control protein FliK [Variimorphobacter saccharofermentans]